MTPTLQRQLTQILILDEALPILVASLREFDSGSEAVEAIETLVKAAVKLKRGLIEELTAWLDSNNESALGPAVRAAIEKVAGETGLALDLATAAELRRDGRLQ